MCQVYLTLHKKDLEKNVFLADMSTNVPHSKRGFSAMQWGSFCEKI